MTPLTAAIVALGTLLGAVLAYLGGRYAVRQSIAANQSGDSAQWERRYRAGVESHLPWDAEMRAAVLHLQDSVNALRARLGLDPEVFPPIPPAPPLFPTPPSSTE